MIDLVRRWIREPVLHFVLLGTAVFVLEGLVGNSDPRQEIVVTAADVAQIAALWERQWRRPPSAEELDNLVQDRVREEILYREALRLGLDEGDTVVRRRLAQKIAFVSEDRALPKEPPQAELEDWFQNHKDRYRRPARISLRQIPFTRAAADEDQIAATMAALEELPRLDDAELADLGDASMLPRRIERWTPREVAAEFGKDFLDALESESAGVWQGPIRSAFGHHAVRIDAYEPDADATLAGARREVERDWLEARRRDANEAFYRELLERYEVTVDPSALIGVEPSS